MALAFTCAARAAEATGAAASGDPWLLWKWVNFALLAAGLGYLISKTAGTYFRSRTESIQKGIAEAAKLKREAEAQAAEIERRIAGLSREVDQLREEASREFAAESDRVAKSTEEALRRIEEHAAQEIESLAKTERLHLKSYAAGLALDLAAEQVRAGLDDAASARLVDGFQAELAALPASERSAK